MRYKLFYFSAADVVSVTRVTSDGSNSLHCILTNEEDTNLVFVEASPHCCLSFMGSGLPMGSSSSLQCSLLWPV